MQRDINVCGCEFRCDYEWDDKCLVLEGVYIEGNDLTDLITDKVTDKIKDKLYEYYHEDLYEMADYAAEIRRAA
jgi:hypothetical protein